jgi:NADH/F420H2 dehydrogenase subunit C
MNIKAISNYYNFLPILVETNGNAEVIYIVKKNNLLHFLTIFKKHINLQYKMLSCISGVDCNTSNYRFQVVYDLLSLRYNSRIRVKVPVQELTNIESITKLFINANWWEREIWDLFGIYFENHPDLRRILTDYGFQGSPLKKNFPLTGFLELKYNFIEKKTLYSLFEITQEYRNYEYNSPWS